MESGYWHRQRADRVARPTLDRDLEVAVCVVGAGITGLTAALLLRRAGYAVVVLEAGRIGSGTTGHSSAHLTVMTDVPLTKLRARVGEDAATAAVLIGRGAIERIAALDRETGGVSGFQRVPGFLWARSPEELHEIGRIATLLDACGERAEAPVDVPLPGGLRGLVVHDQAMFDPLAYLHGLAALAEREGVNIYEHTPVEDWRGGAPCEVRSRERTVRSDHLVLATHTPPGFVPSVQARMAPYSSYVVTVRLSEPLPPGLYWDLADPYHYLRPLPGGRALVGGADHKPGAEDALDQVEALETWARERLSVEGVEDRWMHELFEPADGLPFVGRLPGQSSVWVGSGYSGTGLTWGTFAAERIARGIAGESGERADRFWSPRRVELAGIDRIAVEGFDMIWRFVADRLRADGDLHPGDLLPGEGRLVDVEGQKVAVYHDPTHGLQVLSPVCRHMGCVVHWNALDRTWDCPCHGGRYRADGVRLYGPPTRDLEKRSLEAPPSLQVIPLGRVVRNTP
jgi:glycine/D-amino acid oxidase-like deaminating enzyme/nitrite reductase/ring-hydroxylating ferredoxin subunit